MNYCQFGAERLDEVKAIYREAGWLAYLNDDEKLDRAFRNSLYLLGAFAEDDLIGFIRCVGDGEHVVLIQDLIVSEAYRQRGIGTELMNRVLEKYSCVRMISLYTDAQDKRANSFYRKLGFVGIDANGMISYMK